MSKEALVLSLDLGMREATLIENYLTEDRVVEHFSLRLNNDIEAIRAVFNKVFRGTISVEGNGIYTSELGAFIIEGLEGKRNTLDDFNVFVVAKATIALDLENQLGRLEYRPVEVDGVYNVYINHYFLDVRNEISIVEHIRSTDQFDDLGEFMYPGINVSLMMRMYSESKESNMILTGLPGTGKTCFAKILMASHAKNLKSSIKVAYIKDSDLLKKDEFWARMSSNEPDMIILDDLDEELTPRTEGKNSIVSNMLSFSDGLFDLKTKIVITTNLPNGRIDSALIRPGRCFDILSLPYLSLENARDIWVKEYGHDLSLLKEVGDSVSQAYLASEAYRVSREKNPEYLTDPSISIRRKVEAGHVVNEEE